MSRAPIFAFSLLLLVATASLPAKAQSDASMSPFHEILSTLLSRGYVILENERTWLGRQRIVAEKNGTRREVVFIPGTGEILRDYAVRSSDAPLGLAINSGHGGGDNANRDHARTAGTVGAVTATEAAPSISIGDTIGTGNVDATGGAGLGISGQP